MPPGVPLVKAIFVPSGEKSGSNSSNSRSKVRRVVSVPSVLAVQMSPSDLAPARVLAWRTA